MPRLVASAAGGLWLETLGLTAFGQSVQKAIDDTTGDLPDSFVVSAAMVLLGAECSTVDA
jgi:hypothetical protein